MNRICVLVVLVLACSALAKPGSCPCLTDSLCNRIQQQSRDELFIFSTDSTSWKAYNWTEITTVSAFSQNFDIQLICEAHSHKSRVVFTVDYTDDLSDPEQRSAWIATQVALVVDNFADGLNVDVEHPIPQGSLNVTNLVLLLKELKSSLETSVPGAQLTFDVAWSPDCIDGRCYDYKAIADIVDFVFVMAYDEQSQIFGDCIAMANSPFDKTLHGIERFMELGIDQKKLVLGAPWYGYDYECVDMVNDTICPIKHVTFRNVSCSDAAGLQRNYAVIMPLLKTATFGPVWSDTYQAPYFNYKAGGVTHQVWFDDPRSLSERFRAVRGIRGVGVWNGDALDYSANPVAQAQTQAMWDAFNAFLK